MKNRIFLFAIISFVSPFLMSMTYTNDKATNKEASSQVAFNDFFAKRTLANISISELEIKVKRKFNFLERLAFRKLQKKYRLDLKSNFKDECDVITFKNGEEVKAIVTEVGTSEIKYKKCDNLNGPVYSVKKSEVFMIKYANGSKDFFGNLKDPVSAENNSVNSAEASVNTDGNAIASFISGIISLIVGFFASALFGIAIGIIAVLLANIANSNIKKSKRKLGGKSLALAGAILGIIAMVTCILFIL